MPGSGTGKNKEKTERQFGGFPASGEEAAEYGEGGNAGEKDLHGNENDNDLDSRKYQTDNKGSWTFFRRTIHRPGLQYRRTKCAAGICPAAAGESALSGAYSPAYAAGIHGEPCTAAGRDIIHQRQGGRGP